MTWQEVADRVFVRRYVAVASPYPAETTRVALDRGLDELRGGDGVGDRAVR